MLYNVKVLGKHPEHRRSFTLLRRSSQSLQSILQDIALAVNEKGGLLTNIKILISPCRPKKSEKNNPFLPFEG